MVVMYWLAGAFAVAAWISAKWGRAAAPAVVFAVLALLLMVLTPAGQDVIAFVSAKRDAIATGGAK